MAEEADDFGAAPPPSECRTLADACALYRRRAPAGDALDGQVLVDDRDCRRLLAALRALPLPRWSRPRGHVPEGATDLWVWIWSGFPGGPWAPAFLGELAATAGVELDDARRLWPRVLAARLVLPDGSLAEGAADVLRAPLGRKP